VCNGAPDESGDGDSLEPRSFNEHCFEATKSGERLAMTDKKAQAEDFSNRRSAAYPALTSVFSIDLDRGQWTDDFRAGIHRTVLAEVTPKKFVGTNPGRT